MSAWIRSIIYLKRNRHRCILLLLTLTVISCSLIICFAVWRSSQDAIDSLRKSYGNSFILMPNITDSSKEDTTLWEKEVTDNGVVQYRYKGPYLSDEIVDKVASVEGIEDFCIEQEITLNFVDITFIPGAFADAIEREKKDNDPELSTTLVMAKDNSLKGYSKSKFSSYFRTNAFELREGRHIQEQDQKKVMISDALAKKNHLKIGDNTHAVLNKRSIDGGDPNTIFYEVDLEIIGIFHVNTTQIVSEYTVEPDIAENFMFADVNVTQEARRAYFEAVDLHKEPPYQKVTFFVKDPKDLDQVLEKVQNIEGIDWYYFVLRPDDTAYQSALKPLQNMTRISLFMMAFVIVICIILLVLILRMWIGSRRKEMGILLSIGNSKRSIAGQFILEGVLILAVSVILVGGMAAGVSNGIGNWMLSGMNAQAQRVENARNEEISTQELPAAAEDMQAFIQQFEVKAEAEAPETVDCQVTLPIVLGSAGILSLVLTVVTIFSAKEVLKLKPKEILSLL